MLKIFKKLLAITVILFIAGSITQAQVKVKSFGIEGGWYIPENNYYNDVSVFGGWSDELGGDLYFGANLTIQLIEPVNARIGGGYWQTKLENVISPDRTDEFSLRQIPITLDILVEITFTEDQKIMPYVGLGYGINFITMEYTRNPVGVASIEDSNTGRDYFGRLIAGVNFPVVSQFAVGAEFRYILGQYVQDTISGTSAVGYENSIEGPEIILTLNYLF